MTTIAAMPPQETSPPVGEEVKTEESHEPRKSRESLRERSKAQRERDRSNTGTEQRARDRSKTGTERRARDRSKTGTEGRARDRSKTGTERRARDRSKTGTERRERDRSNTGTERRRRRSKTGLKTGSNDERRPREARHRGRGKSPKKSKSDAPTSPRRAKSNSPNQRRQNKDFKRTQSRSFSPEKRRHIKEDDGRMTTTTAQKSPQNTKRRPRGGSVEHRREKEGRAPRRTSSLTLGTRALKAQNMKRSIVDHSTNLTPLMASYREEVAKSNNDPWGPNAFFDGGGSSHNQSKHKSPFEDSVRRSSLSSATGNNRVRRSSLSSATGGLAKQNQEGDQLDDLLKGGPYPAKQNKKEDQGEDVRRSTRRSSISKRHQNAYRASILKGNQLEAMVLANSYLDDDDDDSSDDDDDDNLSVCSDTLVALSERSCELEEVPEKRKSKRKMAKKALKKLKKATKNVLPHKPRGLGGGKKKADKELEPSTFSVADDDDSGALSGPEKLFESQSELLVFESQSSLK